MRTEAVGTLVYYSHQVLSLKPGKMMVKFGHRLRIMIANKANNLDTFELNIEFLVLLKSLFNS